MNRGRSSFKKVTAASLALLMTFTTLASFSTTEVRAATASTTAVAQEDNPFVTGGRIRNTETVSLTWDVPLTEDTAPVSVATTIATNPEFLGFDTSGIDPDVLDCVSTLDIPPITLTWPDYGPQFTEETGLTCVEPYADEEWLI